MRLEIQEELEIVVDDPDAFDESIDRLERLVDDVEVDQAVEDPRRLDLPRRRRRGWPA